MRVVMSVEGEYACPFRMNMPFVSEKKVNRVASKSLKMLRKQDNGRVEVKAVSRLSWKGSRSRPLLLHVGG